MDFCEKWGTDVDTAVKLALDDLKASIDEVDITVLEEPSRGFFGIGSKLALVRVEKKKVQPEPEPVKEETVISNAQSSSHLKEKKTERFEKPAKSAKRENRRDAEKNGYKEKAVSILGSLDENMVPVEDHQAIRFLKEVTAEMGLNLEISAVAGKDSVYCTISGKDSGTIIGKRGQTLDAIQYLTSLVVNKNSDEYIRVVVDAESYRSKREKTLENLAKRLAAKVVKTKRSLKLEPMNPYERKVIHATLQNHPLVTTRSEGQDPYRRVIIELK